MKGIVGWRVPLLVFGILLIDPACQIDDTREGAGTALDFSLELVSGTTMDAADFFGSVVLLNFWDTWCGSCIEEQDDLNRLYADYRDRGLEIVGISLARYGTAEVANFLATNNVNYTSGVIGASVQTMFGTPETLPHTYIIDREGEIAHSISGAREFEDFASLIVPLLSE